MPGKFAAKGKGKSPLSISERIANVESEIADNAVTGGSVWKVIREFTEWENDGNGGEFVMAVFDSFELAAQFRYELLREFRDSFTRVAITEFYL
jgi:hypothetical protein